MWEGGRYAHYFPIEMEKSSVEEAHMVLYKGYVDETCGRVIYHISDNKQDVNWTRGLREQYRSRLDIVPYQDREKPGIRPGAVYFDKETDRNGKTTPTTTWESDGAREESSYTSTRKIGAGSPESGHGCCHLGMHPRRRRRVPEVSGRPAWSEQRGGGMIKGD